MRRTEHAGPAELPAMQELAARLFPQTGYGSPGELAWTAALTYDDPADNRTAVWWADDQIAAWAWVQHPDELLLQVDPHWPELTADMLSWAESVATGPFEVTVAHTETVVAAALRDRGFRAADDGPFFSCLSRPLADAGAVPSLPPGYQIREVADDRDAQGWVDAHVLAFPGSRFDLARRQHLATVPPYRPEFDLAAFAPDGSLAAYCLGWYDAQNRTGEFEPVGTHPEHRRLGLAAAVCAAVADRFRAVGGERAVVNARGDSAYPAPKLLYTALGFREHTRTWTYRRPG